AEKWARQTEVEIDRDLYLHSRAAEQTALKALVEKYRAEITPQKKGARQEDGRMAMWARHPLALKPVKHLRASDIARYRDQRLKAGASNSTVRLELAALSHIYTVARMEWGFENLVNPVTQVRRPAPAKGRERRVEPGEFEAVIAKLNSSDMRSVALLA